MRQFHAAISHCNFKNCRMNSHDSFARQFCTTDPIGHAPESEESLKLSPKTGESLGGEFTQQGSSEFHETHLRMQSDGCETLGASSHCPLITMHIAQCQFCPFFIVPNWERQVEIIVMREVVAVCEKEIAFCRKEVHSMFSSAKEHFVCH